MCGDSSLCCCQGKCQHVRSHFTSQMKETLFFCCLMPSQASCLKPCLCCLNGLHEWPVLVLCVWATMVSCGTFVCFSLLYIISVVVVSRKIPLEHPGVVIEQLEFDLINVREKNNMPFQPGFGFPDEMRWLNITGTGLFFVSAMAEKRNSFDRNMLKFKSFQWSTIRDLKQVTFWHLLKDLRLDLRLCFLSL